MHIVLWLVFLKKNPVIVDSMNHLSVKTWNVHWVLVLQDLTHRAAHYALRWKIGNALLMQKKA
jgi:hypothetical protein